MRHWRVYNQTPSTPSFAPIDRCFNNPIARRFGIFFRSVRIWGRPSVLTMGNIQFSELAMNSLEGKATKKRTDHLPYMSLPRIRESLALHIPTAESGMESDLASC